MIEARVNLATVHKALDGVRHPDLRPAWLESRKPLRTDIRQHRDRREGPEGAWAPQAASTKARAGRRGRAKKLLGRLPSALYTVLDRDRLGLRSRVRWSQVHQAGGTGAHGAKIRARPFLWASPEVVRTIAAAVERHLDRVWEEAARGA